MEDDDNDEEVVLKNSALYTHLLENGLNDFESVEIPKTYNRNSTPDTFEEIKKEKDGIHEENDSLCKFVDIILNSNLIFQDDILIIRNFIVVYRKDYSFLKSSYFKLIYQTSSASAICLLCYFCKIKFKPIILYPLSFLPLGALIVKRTNRVYIEYKDRTRINGMIKNMKDLSIMLHKCVKFIQEFEVVMYHSISQNKIKSSFGIPIGSNGSRNQVMFQLRCTVYDTLQSVILHLKTAICSLVKDFPIKKSADSMNFYLAFLSEEELHCSKKEKESISIDELQKMKYIYLLLQSEFLKRLCLNMNPFLCIERINKDELFHFVTTISVNCARLYSQIKDVFQFFYILEKPDEHKTTSNADWIYKEAYVKICSVSHNLQTLLKESRQIEEYLENTRLQNSDHNKVISVLDVFCENLSLQYENCKPVVEDFKNYVSRQKPKPSSDTNSAVSVSNDTEATDKTILIVGKSDFHPSCPDEVFIGVSTQEKKTDEENPDEDYIVTKKCSKLLISELKLALKDKAQEWRERERVALQNKNLIDEDEHLSSETESSSDEELSNTIRNKRIIERADSESSNGEYADNGKQPLRGFPMGTTFAEKIAFASSKWGLKSDEFVGDSEDDDLES